MRDCLAMVRGEKGGRRKGVVTSRRTSKADGMSEHWRLPELLTYSQVEFGFDQEAWDDLIDRVHQNRSLFAGGGAGREAGAGGGLAAAGQGGLGARRPPRRRLSVPMTRFPLPHFSSRSD